MSLMVYIENYLSSYTIRDRDISGLGKIVPHC